MVYGSGKYAYELVDGWAKLPEGTSFLDIGGISIDAQDKDLWMGFCFGKALDIQEGFLCVGIPQFNNPGIGAFPDKK